MKKEKHYNTLLKSISSSLAVHSRARNIGIGKTLVKKLNINKVFNPLKVSLLFWEKCGVTDFL